MRTVVYVDALNLYYGVLKDTRFKWLDLPLLFKTVLKPHHDIELIKYFTTRVSRTPKDPSKPQRQDTYLQALARCKPRVEIHYGYFLTNKVTLPLVEPIGNIRKVRVIRPEEKGSDVNLAVHLLYDALAGDLDCAVVVTNDSDIAEALRLVKRSTDVKIGLLTPGGRGGRRVSFQLKQHATFHRPIRPKDLKASQLPDIVPGTNIRKPARW